MIRFASVLSLILFIICHFVPITSAGPACARKHHNTPTCIQRCKSKWGWPSKGMGTDPWGPVLENSNSEQAADAALSKACGSNPAHTQSPVADVQTPNSTPTQKPSPSVSGTSTLPITTPSLSSTSTIGVIATTSKSSTMTVILPTPKPPTTTTHIPVVTPTSSVINQPVPPPPTSSPSGGTSSSDIQAYLSGHNSIRAQHGAAALTWSDTLASKAQQWANGCKFQHSKGSLGPFGENLAAGTGSAYGIAAAIKSWTDEVSEYDPGNPQPSHFTQVVWKATTQVGCAVQLCDGIFDPSFGKAKYFVCEYSPAGNVIGHFPENVQA